MTTTSIDRPLGYKEIAELLDVKPTTVRMWKYHDMLPPPDWESVHGMPAWTYATVVVWAGRTGRLYTKSSSGLFPLVKQYKALTGNDPAAPRHPGGRPLKETP